MKFRYKVLLINLILLSVSLGSVGYLMIRRNFELAQETQLKNAIIENNLAQASIEYELLQVLNSEGSSIVAALSEIGERVVGGIMIESTSFYVRYGETYVYSSDGEEARIREALFSNLDIGGKNYIICEEDRRYYIYVTSYSSVSDEGMYVISRQDISDSYLMLDEQIRYFRVLIAGIVLAASVIMYLVSVYLTRPLEKLNRMANEITAGHYDVQVEVRGRDEVGQLAESVNVMANAVLHHVEELNDMIHRREQFVADFTHELKTPMTTIIGYSDMLRSMELSREEQIFALNYIFSEGKRLEIMSRKLFELIYLKRHEIEMNPVHMENLERELVRIVGPMLERKRITFETDVEAAVVSGDKELLLTVCMNFVDNARKASEEGSVIKLIGKVCQGENAEEHEGKAIYELQVVDYGIGMSKEDAKHIFDEFYMVDKSRSRKEGGAGLGLSLAALILDKHQARLSVDSTPGEGTTMRVIFYEME